MSRIANAPVHLREGLRILLRRPVATLVASLALSLGLFSVAFTTWSTSRLAEAEAVLDADLHVFAALDPALDEAQTKDTLSKVAADPAVRTVRWVGPNEQRERLGRVLGEASLEGLDREVFPVGGLLEIQLTRPVIRDGEALATFRERLASIGAVHGIDALPFDSRHMRLLLDAGAVTRVLGLALGLIGLLGAALAVFLLIQGERREARATLQVYRDFGATAAFIRARFFIAAITLALLGGALAVVLGLIASGPLTDLVSIVPGLEGSSLAGILLYAWSVAGGMVVALGACALALRGEGQILGGGSVEAEAP